MFMLTHALILTDFKDEKTLILCELFDAEKLIAYGWSEDFDRYTKIGLRLAPNDPGFLQMQGNLKFLG